VNIDGVKMALEARSSTFISLAAASGYKSGVVEWGIREARKAVGEMILSGLMSSRVNIQWQNGDGV
jgi:hypothetical protein